MACLFGAPNGYAEGAAFYDTSLEQYESVPDMGPVSVPNQKTPAPFPASRLKRRVPVVPVDADFPDIPKDTGTESSFAAPPETPNGELQGPALTPEIPPAAEEEPEREYVPPVTTGWYYAPKASPGHSPGPAYTRETTKAETGPDDAETRISYLFDPNDLAGRQGMTVLGYCETINRDGRQCHMGRPFLVIETLLTVREFCLALGKNGISCHWKDPLTLELLPSPGSRETGGHTLTLGFEKYIDTLLIKSLARPGQRVSAGPDAAKFLISLAAPFL